MARILLVQRDGEESRDLRRVLQDAGHAVAAASSSLSVSNLCESYGADIVIADLGRDGQESPGWIMELRLQRVDVKVIAICPSEAASLSLRDERAWDSFMTSMGVCTLSRPLDPTSLLAAVDGLAQAAL